MILPTSKPVRCIWLDFETQSAEDIEHGSAKYAEHPTTRAYMASLIVFDSLTQQEEFYIWTDLPFALQVPEPWRHIVGREALHPFLTSETHEVWVIAHNVSFERNILRFTLRLPEPQRWLDTIDIVYSRGLPGSLDRVGELLYGLPKNPEAKALIRRLSVPYSIGKKRGHLPPITQVEVQKLLAYNMQDVHLCKRITHEYGLLIEPEWEQRVRDCHQRINARGVRFDVDFALKLDSMERYFIESACRKVAEVTNGDLTGDDLLRVQFLKDAINENLPDDLKIDDLRASTLENLLSEAQHREDVGPEVLEVIKARLIVSRAALDKVRAGLQAVNSDGRLRDQFAYWGAFTGRWAGRITQPQNMKRPDDSFNLEAAFEAVQQGKFERVIELCIDAKGVERQPYELLGSLIRGIFIPEPGHKFIIGDFSSIEARVLMWLADQHEGLEEHRRADAGEIDDVYCAFASAIYQRPISKKEKKERQVGKVGQLACGYGGGENAVLRMAQLCKVDLVASGIEPGAIVRAWRQKYANVPRYWRQVEQAFIQAAQGSLASAGKCRFFSYVDHGQKIVQVVLPSGRSLHYRDVQLQPLSENRLQIFCKTYVRSAMREKYLYGGLLTENIDQALSRDCLAGVLVRAMDERGYFVPLHVHDELVLEVPESEADSACAWLRDAMRTSPSWAPQLPLWGDPGIFDRYGKA